MPGNERKYQYKTISTRAAYLLSREEGYDVEFKESLNGLDNSDLVAFANSDAGGSILIGVKEVRTRRGGQQGEIVGCPCGDKERLKILNKAESCVPPVHLEVFTENLNKIPFFRIEIPSGEEKPYCTLRGTYKIRGNGRTNALTPGRLLTMFMEVESREFVERFKGATRSLEGSLIETKSKVIREMEGLLEYIRDMEFQIHTTLDRIEGQAEEAVSYTSEGLGFSDETLGAVGEVDRKVDVIDEMAFGIEARLKALLTHLQVEDPMTKRDVKLFVRDHGLKGKRDKKRMLSRLKEAYPGIAEEKLRSWYEEAVQEWELLEPITW